MQRSLKNMDVRWSLGFQESAMDCIGRQAKGNGPYFLLLGPICGQSQILKRSLWKF